jgi:hypothetical protein
MTPFLHENDTLILELNVANGTRTHGCLELDDAGKALHYFGSQDVVVVAAPPSSKDPLEVVTAIILIQQNGSAVGKALALPFSKVEQLKRLTREDIDYIFPDLPDRLAETE